MNFKRFIKLILSLGAITLVLSMVNWPVLKKTVSAIPPLGVALVISGYVAGQLLSVLKWQIIAASGGVHKSYVEALKSYFTGMFINAFGLGMVGGDVARGLLLGAGTDKKSAAIASVIADRIQGLAVLSTIGTIALLIFGDDHLEQYWFYIITGLGLSFAVGWYFAPKILLLIIGPKNKFREKAEHITAAFPTDLRTIITITCISVVFHLTQISLHWVMGWSLGLNLPVTALLVCVPFVNIMSSLPISWNGLGVREAGYIFFLTPHLLNQEQAVAFGALWLLATTTSSAIGGIIALLSNEYKILNQETKTTAPQELEEVAELPQAN